MKTMVVLIGPMVCAFHIVMTSLYLSPPNVLTNRTKDFVDSYMLPFFYQDWHLFSPDPGFTTEQLWVRCGGSEKNGQNGTILFILCNKNITPTDSPEEVSSYTSTMESIEV